MKTYNKILSALVLAGSLTLTACDESFLEVSPNDRVTLDNFFQSENDLRAATAGLYNKVWFDFNDKFYFSDEKYPWGNVCYFDFNNRAESKVLIPQVY